MSDNLLELLNGAVGPTLVGQASTFLGESETATRSAVRTALPALLAGVAQQAATPEDASALMSRVKSSAVDSNLLGNLGTLLGSPGSSDALLSSGGTLLQGVFGDRVGSVTDAIASVSGMQSSSVGKLLAISAPAVFAFLKNYVALKWLDAGGLARLLTSQGEFLEGSLDDRITSAMGLGGVGSFLTGLANKAAGVVTGAGTEVASAARSAGDAAARAAETVARTGAQAVSGAAQAVGDVAGKATELATDAGSAVAGTVKQAGAAVTGAAKEAGAAAAGVARAAVDTAGEVAEKATGTAKAAGSEALSTVKSAGATVEEVATKTARVAEKAGKGAYEALEKAVESEAPGLKKYVPWIAAGIIILLLLLIF